MGRRAMAHHGRDLADQGPARLRPADNGDRRVLIRRMGAVSGNSPRRNRRSHRVVIDRNRWLFNWHTVAASAGRSRVYMPVRISARIMGTQGLDMVYRENVVRFFDPFDHRGPIYSLPLRDLRADGAVARCCRPPWCRRISAAHQRRAGQSDRFALVYFWSTFIFFTLSGSRRSYYILPILPPAAIWSPERSPYPGEYARPSPATWSTVGYVIVAFAAIASIGLMIPAWAVCRAPTTRCPTARQIRLRRVLGSYRSPRSSTPSANSVRIASQFQWASSHTS